MAAKNEPLYNDEVYNDEGLSKDILLNLSDILSKIDEIYEARDEVEEEADPEKFCEDCEHIVIVKEREQYFGATCYREFPFCRAEFDPEDPTCPRYREYKEALENRNRIRKALDTLYQAEEAFMNKKGA